MIIISWVLPALSSTASYNFPILTWMVQSMRNEEIIVKMSLGSSISWSFFSRLLCHTASKAFLTSMSSSAASFLLSLIFFMYSLMIIMCSFASLCGWYAHCYGLMILLSSIYSCILLEMIFSNSFPMQFSRLMGL